MVNPEWGYWWRFWSRQRPVSLVFRCSTSWRGAPRSSAALLMLVPPTRDAGRHVAPRQLLFIVTQIRLGFLCEMVMVCCLLFVHPGSVVDGWMSAVVAPPGSPATSRGTGDG